MLAKAVVESKTYREMACSLAPSLDIAKTVYFDKWFSATQQARVQNKKPHESKKRENKTMQAAEQPSPTGVFPPSPETAWDERVAHGILVDLKEPLLHARNALFQLQKGMDLLRNWPRIEPLALQSMAAQSCAFMAKHTVALTDYDDAFFSAHQKPRLYVLHLFSDVVLDFYHALHAVTAHNADVVKPVLKALDLSAVNVSVRDGLDVISDHFSTVRGVGLRLDQRLPREITRLFVPRVLAVSDSCGLT